MPSTIVHSTSTESAAAAREAERKRQQHAAIASRIICAADEARDRAAHRTETGHCTACGSNEVALNRVSSRSIDGTSSGWGCEVCD